MKKYIPKFNARFSVIPKGKPVFRKLDRGINIDYIKEGDIIADY